MQTSYKLAFAVSVGVAVGAAAIELTAARTKSTDSSSFLVKGLAK